MNGLYEIRCPGCGLLLMAIRGRAEVKCRKCKSMVLIDTEKTRRAIVIANTKKIAKSAG